ncbi:Putative ribosomal protein L22/L17 [Septoria linicola]|uniref:Ribosomal protein L22/L17 n=1 Tax=Septoria linicola TaxID=215465 RepID=A0A9Q9EM14_9PEZI|nr:putative ribosomal protein L22/L17 [Septoria linicola]USW53988.1 Putative ribosomal protein L22/L17 [Septoria linicola]
MSVSAPARRLVSKCTFCSPLPIRTIQHQQRRTAVGDFFKRGTSTPKAENETTKSDNPILDEYRRQNPDTPAPQGQQTPQAMPQQGDIASSSIFEDERRIAAQRERDGGQQDGEDGTTTVGGVQRNPTSIARVTQPDPNARERWERKKVIQMIKNGGRLSKAQFIKRTEREHLVKSHNMKTSVKKLGMIARQIAGKTIDDAITQMRFSKKLVAQEVLKQLEHARDEAVVMRGMGLGNIASADGAEIVNESPASNNVAATADGSLEAAKALQAPTKIAIQLKDGKRHKVEDRSNIYIDQAWVGRGPYGQLPDYRARGRVFIMRTPWTSLSIVLKEEATRIREHAEREAKRRKKITDKMWVPLPDRPLTTNRQWYSW